MEILKRCSVRIKKSDLYRKLFPSRENNTLRKTAICIFVITFLVPYLRVMDYPGQGVSYTTSITLLILGGNYFSSICGSQEVIGRLKGIWRATEKTATKIFKAVYDPIDRIEHGFMKLKHLGTMINQIAFFALCDDALVPGQRVTYLYSLMFYNVIAYCVSYMKELYEKEDWSPYINMTEHSNIRHLAMSATKIVLEWTKAISFIITVVFMLLVFGLEQGLEHYKPSNFYTVITIIYYFMTEKIFVELLTHFIIYLQIPKLENLEKLWIATCFQIATALVSFIFVILEFIRGRFRMGFVGLYLNVYIRLKECYLMNYKHLRTEINLLSPYRFASAEELGNIDDVCAVCLNPMRLARIIPCHHVFHGDCLRNCLKTSNRCPICKRELKFD